MRDDLAVKEAAIKKGGERLVIAYVRLSQAALWDRNPKRHDLRQIAQSIARYGFKDPPKYEPALNSGAGGIVEGNGRLASLRLMKDTGLEMAALLDQGLVVPPGILEMNDGEWAVPLLFGVDAQSQASAEAYGVDHNNLTLAGGDFTTEDMRRLWDSDVLISILRDQNAETLPVTSEDFDALGLLALASDDTVNSGDDETENKLPKTDKGPELRKKWQTELGQTWQMGNHTLFIGSAEGAGIECDFAIFDPPFNWAWQRQENALSWGIWKTALVMGLAQCMPLAVRDDFWHWWVWDAGMNRFGGRGHRPVTGCAMMILLGEHSWHESAGLAALDRYEIKHFDWPTQVVHIQDHLAGREYKHEKPYPLTDYILSLYSVQGDVVGDLFAGSGAFLIACENLKRQYHGAELSPENAAVILDRWTRTFEVEPCLL